MTKANTTVQITTAPSEHPQEQDEPVEGHSEQELGDPEGEVHRTTCYGESLQKVWHRTNLLQALDRHELDSIRPYLG